MWISVVHAAIWAALLPPIKRRVGGADDGLHVEQVGHFVLDDDRAKNAVAVAWRLTVMFSCTMSLMRPTMRPTLRPCSE